MSIQSQLQAIAKKRMQDVSEIARASIIRVGNRVTTESPVDKATFINSWNTSINNLKYEKRAGKSGGQDSLDELNQVVSSMDLGATAYFNNPQPYGHRLEYDAWSEKAPDGFLRKNTMLWEQIVEEEIARRR